MQYFQFHFLLKDNFLISVDKIARYFWTKLKQLENTYDEIVEVRGAGLLLGIKTKNNNVDFSLALRKNKLLSVPAGDNVIRFAPPLIISNEEINKKIDIFSKKINKKIYTISALKHKGLTTIKKILVRYVH